jgi:hypothetical protein
VRKFRIGPLEMERSVDVPPAGDAVSSARAPSSSSLHHTNTWPDPEVWGYDKAATFQSTIEHFYSEACRASQGIVCAICHGLLDQAGATAHVQNPDTASGLTKDFVQKMAESLMGPANKEGPLSSTDKAPHAFSQPQDTSILTLLGYRKGARHQGKCARPLMAHHTDVGVLTMLVFDQGNAAVLQRKHPQTEEWIDVILPPVDGGDSDGPHFVINVGDCLSEMCGNVLPSTLHRVMPRLPSRTQPQSSNNGSTTRNGLALFVGLDANARITLLPADGDTSGASVSMTYKEWRKARIARATRTLQEFKEVIAHTPRS